MAFIHPSSVCWSNQGFLVSSVAQEVRGPAPTNMLVNLQHGIKPDPLVKRINVKFMAWVSFHFHFQSCALMWYNQTNSTAQNVSQFINPFFPPTTMN